MIALCWSNSRQMASLTETETESTPANFRNVHSTFLVSKRDQRRAAWDAGVFHALFPACLTKWVNVSVKPCAVLYLPIYFQCLLFLIADLEGIVKRRPLAFGCSTRKCYGSATLAWIRKSSHRLARQGKNKAEMLCTPPNRYRNVTVIVLESRLVFPLRYFY